MVIKQWGDGRPTLDIVDLDVAGATSLAVRRIRCAGVGPLSEDDFADVEPLAMVSLSVGLDMAREDEEWSVLPMVMTTAVRDGARLPSHTTSAGGR